MAMSEWKNVGGMFRLNCGNNLNIKELLTSSIIDYAKLTSDNFAVINIGGGASTGASTHAGDANAHVKNAFTPSYDSTTGILSFSNKKITARRQQVGIDDLYGYGTMTANTILFCDIATCAKIQ